MPKEIAPAGRDEHGDEAHPAYGMIGATRVSHSPPGKALFDSDVQHQHYVVLRIDRATRRRDLHRDWVHSSGFGKIVEVAMSEAQWASMISSMNTSGVPCTIQRTERDGDVPGLDLDSRLDLSHRETREAAHRAFDEVKEAFEAVEEKPTKANLRALRARIENAPANVEYAAKSLTEHAENVVQKARADIEAMAMHKAQELGLDPKTWTPIEELDAGREQPRALEARPDAADVLRRQIAGLEESLETGTYALEGRSRQQAEDALEGMRAYLRELER